MTRCCPHCMQPMPGERTATAQPAEAIRPLSPSELEIWFELQRHAGKTVTLEALATRAVTHETAVGTSPEVVRTHVCRLRKKLPSARILTDGKRGYRLEVPQ